MRWRGGRQSTNVEDRRGTRRGGGGGLKIGGGLGGIVVLLIGAYFGIDLSGLTGGGGGGFADFAPASSSDGVRDDDETTAFVKTMLGSTEDTWSALFQEAGERYRPPVLVLFTDQVQSACGSATAASGPFYCPGDDKLYIDLGFFRELERMGAGGDFAQAYVLAHEVGHHVQNLLGVSMAVQKRQRSLPKAEANALSVRTELQADCYAGVWANRAQRERQFLEPGDLEEGMNAAGRIGDDALMSAAGASVRPEKFTHGSSEQRRTWLARGLDSGDPQACDTFAGT